MKNKILSFILVSGILVSCASNKKTEYEKTNQENIEQSKLNPELTDANKQNIWNEIKKKEAFFKSDLNAENNLNNVPNEFIDFAENFISDSIYQIHHIDFKRFLGAIGECDTTIVINSNNWTFTQWDFLDDFTAGNENEPIDKWNNSVYASNNRIIFDYYQNEIGLIYQIGFEKANDEWFLTLYRIIDC